MKLVIADDQPVVRAGVCSLLEGSGINVVGEAANGEAAVRQVSKQKPDVLLLEVRLPKADGFWALAKIREKSPRTRVIVFSNYDYDFYIARAIALGVGNYLIKNCTRRQLIEAIEGAVAGRDPDEGSRFMQITRLMERRLKPSKPETSLTNRQFQILLHVALGLTNQEIAYALDISVETVKEHIQNLLRRLDVPDRTAAAVWAVKNGAL